MPDDHAIEREAVRELRGAILRYLATSYRFHTSAAEESVKKHCLKIMRAPVGRYNEAICYLRDEAVGLVKVEPVKVDGLDEEPVEFLKLTARGYLLVTGQHTDPGVVM